MCYPEGRCVRSCGRFSRSIRAAPSPTLNVLLPIHSSISPLSVSNELRRNKDKLYRKRARLWYLIKQAENETAGNAFRASPAVSPNLNLVEPYETAPTGITTEYRLSTYLASGR